jgi:hypothetical protein
LRAKRFAKRTQWKRASEESRRSPGLTRGRVSKDTGQANKTTGNAVGNFFGNIDDQSFQTFHIIGNGYMYAFFIIGACLLAAGFLVRWQVRRIERIFARIRAEDANATRSGGSGGGTGEAPRG